MSRARFVLAFSNAVDRQPYTHPVREYITGRWTDALAAGAIVCGIPPTCEVARSSFWPGALLTLPSTDRAGGLNAIHRALLEWTPGDAARNHREALKRLDWRWRLREAALVLGVSAHKVDEELALVHDKTHAPQHQLRPLCQPITATGS
jgi:hypothetical protein